MGDNGQGPVLPGQPQGVKQGPGVSIASDGTISFNPTTASGVVKTNNQGAFNSYTWPNAPESDAFLFNGTSNSLLWVKKGFGLSIEGSTSMSLKPIVPQSATEPVIGTGNNEAAEGSLYWNSENNTLFISINDEWAQVSYGPVDLSSELLTGSYTLYVNPEIGSDEYVTGVYNSEVTPVITNQMTVAGYTPQRPFKTIARAALEVARIQIALGSDSQLFDRFVIKCSSGEHSIDNALGSNSVLPWVNGTTPSAEALRAMNSSSFGGIILPRGVSVIGEDLRKTVIRPTFVPDRTGDIEDDRASILRVTGGAFFFNFTFKDKLGHNQSHHLLECFSFVSDSDLTSYYNKVQTVFDQDAPNQIVAPGETEIVAPAPQGSPEEDTDGVFGSSPYIFNCSVRSSYGLCGIDANGSNVTGFRSIVTAQFTGVSIQKDLTCWQRYNTGPKTWTNTITNYSTYISLDPNNVRMDPLKKSFHIKASNGAFIQEVSVFAIGQGIHHWAKSGGEISITNSNSSFGGCAALAEGYRSEAFPQDTNWNVGSISIATNLTDQTLNVVSIYIGTIDSGVANNATTLVLTEPLLDSPSSPGNPEILNSKNYSLRAGSYLWVENPVGPDWRSPLTASAWNSSQPDEIEITVPLESDSGETPGSGINPDLAGNRVYIRRLVDNRSVDQRRYSLIVTNTDNNVRTPLRDYVIQTVVGPEGGIDSLLPEEDMVLVNKSGPIPIGNDPVVKKVQITVQRSNATNLWGAGKFYRPGDTVRYQNKHYTCLIQNSDTLFDTYKWNQSYVHMPSDYNAYDYFSTLAPSVYFDNDTDGDGYTQNCGYNLSTCWVSDPLIKAQYTSSTDYRGVLQFLLGIGFSLSEAEDILTPTTTANRELNPASNVDMKGYVPDGAASLLSNWPIEFRRPTIIRMFGHSWEWAGFLNYTKALPSYQGDLSVQNQFTYYFTNSLGGRVYATGFNQEGYFVSAAGLTDLATGSVTSVADIGNPFGGVDIPTYYPNLVVDNLTVENNLIIGESCQIQNFPLASETQAGIIEIATNEEVKQFTSNTLAVTPATLIQALGDSVKNVVNLRLSLSSTSAVPSSDQSGSTLYVHPWNGNEIALYEPSGLYPRWYVLKFDTITIPSFSLSSLAANTLYDIYLYNSGTLLTPVLAADFSPWVNDSTPPSRGYKDGIPHKSGEAGKRLVGVIRTTTAGNSTISLGGVVSGSGSSGFPKVYLANLYNLYDARAVYFFGDSWDYPTLSWATPPSSVYPVAPRVSFVQANNTLVTAFLDIYNNPLSSPYECVIYVAPGIDSTTAPPDDAFYGECQLINTTAGSQWARSLTPGLHNIYYLYKQQAISTVINEHPNHGMIVVVKI